MRKFIITGVFAIAALTGCASDRDNRILTGAAVGGVIGNAIGGPGATIGGAVIGGWLGSASADERRYYESRDSREQRRYNECRNAGYSHRKCVR